MENYPEKKKQKKIRNQKEMIYYKIVHFIYIYDIIKQKE